MILVDTSVWVGHFARRNARLSRLLDQGQVLTHPFVIGELALGSFRNREEIFRLLTALPEARTLPHQNVLALVDRRDLAGAGVGWVDAHLLASALVDGAPIWTLDRALAAIARRLGIHAD